MQPFKPCPAYLVRGKVRKPVKISFDFSSELSEEMEISPVDFETPWKPYGRFCYFRVRLLPWAWTRQPFNRLPQMGQVWPLMQFYSICLCKKNHWFVWRSSQCPPIGRILFFSVPPSNFFILVSDPFAYLDKSSFKGPQLCVVVWFQTNGRTGHPVCVVRLALRSQDIVETTPWPCVYEISTMIIYCKKLTE